MSAQSASETPSNANSLARDRVASLRTVQVPGSPATYPNRAYLRDLGLRWDPINHRWHGATTAEAVKTLRDQLHLVVRVFGVLEGDAPKGTAASKPVPGPTPVGVPDRDPARRPHDGSRTRVEARVAFPTPEEAEEVPAPTRRFTVMEITSGLPDDSCEADEKETERRLRDLRGRVKSARAVVTTTPNLADTLARDWQKAARFYARFGITEEIFRNGVSAGDVTGKVLTDASCHPVNAFAKEGEHSRGVLPSAA